MALGAPSSEGTTRVYPPHGYFPPPAVGARRQVKSDQGTPWKRCEDMK